MQRIRKSIECWLTSETHALLLHVPDHENGAGFWQPITGGIEPGEGAPAAAVREVREETGICIEPIDLAFLASGVLVEISPTLLIEKTLFRAQIDQIEIRLSAEHDRYQFVPLDEVDSWLSWQSQRQTWRTVSTWRDM